MAWIFSTSTRPCSPGLWGYLGTYCRFSGTCGGVLLTLEWPLPRNGVCQAHFAQAEGSAIRLRRAACPRRSKCFFVFDKGWGSVLASGTH